MSLSSKIKSASFWQFLQICIQILAQFGYMAYMARILSKSDFGLMAIVSSFIGFGVLFSEGGMGAALIQRKDITKRHISVAFHSSILISTFLFIILFFSAGLVSSFFKHPELEKILQFIGLIIVLNSINNVCISLLQKSFKFKKTSIVISIVTVIGYTVGILCAIENMGVWSMIMANFTIALLNTIVFLCYVPIKLFTIFHLKEFKELFQFGYLVLLSRLITSIAENGLNLILGVFFTSAMLGSFERINTLKSLPSRYLGDVLDRIMFPLMSQMQDDKDYIFKIYQLSIGIVNSILIPVSFVLIFFSKFIVLILLGENWLNVVLPLQILFIVLPFTSSVRMADSLVRATGQVHKNVQRRFYFMLVLLITTSFGGYYFDLIGACIGVSFSFVFNYFIMLKLIKSYFNKSFSEIFTIPLVSGLKITFVIAVVLFFSSVILDLFNITYLLREFLVFNFSFLISVFIFCKKRKLLGFYLTYLLDSVFKKRLV